MIEENFNMTVLFVYILKCLIQYLLNFRLLFATKL